MIRTFDARYVDTMFLVASGRIAWDVEAAAMRILGVDSLREFYVALKTCSDDQLQTVWDIVKTTPAAAAIA
jgi:hypothetical protein